MALQFQRDFDPRHGSAVDVAPGVARVTAPNSGPFTFHGTNSYIVGSERLAVIDPGPHDESHLEALLAAIAGRPVTHILVTHTHRDHSPLAARLRELTGAAMLGHGPHRPAGPAPADSKTRLDAGGDTEFEPDRRLADGEVVDGGEWRLRAVHTPGHASNHLAFALEGTGLLFSGDHVMAWSTTVIAPPDGDMADYMASLDKLLARDDRVFLPGHGGPVTEPRRFIRGLKAHRRMREEAILERLRAGDRTIPAMVARIYQDVNPALHRAAGLSMLAHLQDLAARGLVAAEPEPTLEAEFRIAGK
jgi:glyoxylase-like metal-dependent hydrolase (beta-lactamase superfamily II)